MKSPFQSPLRRLRRAPLLRFSFRTYRAVGFDFGKLGDCDFAPLVLLDGNLKQRRKRFGHSRLHLRGDGRQLAGNIRRQNFDCWSWGEAPAKRIQHSLHGFKTRIVLPSPRLLRRDADTGNILYILISEPLPSYFGKEELCVWSNAIGDGDQSLIPTTIASDAVVCGLSLCHAPIVA